MTRSRLTPGGDTSRDAVEALPVVVPLPIDRRRHKRSNTPDRRGRVASLIAAKLMKAQQHRFEVVDCRVPEVAA